MDINAIGINSIDPIGYKKEKPSSEKEEKDVKVNEDKLEISEDYRKKAAEKNEDKEIIPDENGEASSEISEDEKAAEKTDEDEKKPSEDEENEKESEGKTTVSVNVEKRRRQIAAAQNTKELNQVLALLDGDLSDCKEGLKNGWCDESEVAKAEMLISQAKSRAAEVAQNDDKEETGFDAFDLAMLM